ncbi:MAG: adenosylcobinamide-GDP ribazoletransferase [Elainellaceae cyanobacterium]
MEFTEVDFNRETVVIAEFIAAIAFYTCLPIPSHWHQDYRRIAYFAPFVGLFIGGLLSLADIGLQHLGMPILTRSAVVVVTWVGITGGLHLDGAMDMADGLAVTDPRRRLDVMADSATGAFGAMAAIALVLLKVSAIADFTTHRWMPLLIAPILGRWAQQVAIARYPYLKPIGKGAFHKAAVRSLLDVVPGALLLVGLTIIWGITQPSKRLNIVGAMILGGAIALSTGAWIYHKLGGQTGDTYGAIVEWTEALFWVGTTLLVH